MLLNIVGKIMQILSSEWQQIDPGFEENVDTHTTTTTTTDGR